MKKLSLAVFAAFMIAAAAVAHDGGHGGGPGPGDAHYGAAAEVGADGTLYLSNVTVSSGAASTTITAIRPTGTVAWTKTLSVGAEIQLSDGNVIAESYVRNSDGTVTTTLTAIANASGATAWTKTLNGRADLIPFSGGTYAIVTVPSTTSGGAPTRSLVGIGNDGSTLFTLAL